MHCSKCRLDWKVGLFKYRYQNNCYLVNISPAVKKIDRCNLILWSDLRKISHLFTSHADDQQTVIIEYSQLGHVYQCQFMLNLSSIIQIKFMHVRIYLHQVKMRKTLYYSCYSFTTSFEKVVYFFILCNNLLSCFQIYMHQRMRFPSINTFCQMHETQVYYIGITVFWIAVNDKLVYKTIKMQNTKFKIKKT